MSIKKYDLYVYQKYNGATRIYGNYTDILNFVSCFIEFDDSISGEDRIKIFDNLINKRKRKSKRNYFVDMDELYTVRMNLRTMRNLRSLVYNLYIDFFGGKK